MSSASSVPPVLPGHRSQDVRPRTGAPAVRPGSRGLDEVDRRIIALLAADARITNSSLAEQVGIAPSTCLGRVRALQADGVILGFHAEIDPAALGRPLQAMISVRLQAGARNRLRAFTERIGRRPEVVNLYFLAGADDFLVQVATADAEALRAFVVDELSAHTEVALTETNLIFEHLRGSSPVG